MKTIFKYEIPMSGEILVPDGAKFLSVQIQNNALVGWALVETDAASDFITLDIYGTGHQIKTEGRHVGTVQDNGLVFHVFQRQN